MKKCIVQVDISWRFSFVSDFEHTIGDGLVANYFHEVLLKNLAECESIEDAAFETQFGPLVLKISKQKMKFSILAKINSTSRILYHHQLTRF